MAYLIELSRLAEAEVLETFVRKSESSPTAASQWYKGLREALESLTEYPKRCSLAPENDVFPEEVRQRLYGRKGSTYRIVFVVRGVTVFILTVRHGSQRPLSPDEEGDSSEGSTS